MREGGREKGRTEGKELRKEARKEGRKEGLEVGEGKEKIVRHRLALVLNNVLLNSL